MCESGGYSSFEVSLQPGNACGPRSLVPRSAANVDIGHGLGISIEGSLAPVSLGVTRASDLVLLPAPQVSLGKHPWAQDYTQMHNVHSPETRIAGCSSP